MVNNTHNGFTTRYNVFPYQYHIFNHDNGYIRFKSMIVQFNGFIT